MGTFTPPALPGFFAKPLPIAEPLPFASLPFYRLLHILAGFRILTRGYDSAWSAILRPCGLLDAVYDPGAGPTTRHLRDWSCCLQAKPHPRPLSTIIFGAHRIQCPTLHLAVLPSLSLDSSVYSAWLGLTIGGFTPPERRPFPGLRLNSIGPSDQFSPPTLLLS